jgi:hypothetical protein
MIARQARDLSRLENVIDFLIEAEAKSTSLPDWRKSLERIENVGPPLVGMVADLLDKRPDSPSGGLIPAN